MIRKEEAGRDMTLEEICRELEEIAPLTFAESWDNSGLICGRKQKEIRKILLTVDVTDEVAEEAKRSGADLILAHHPLIFSPVCTITEDDIIGRRLLKLIGSDIACYAMHTNFDVCHMADAAADRLELKERAVLMETCEADGKAEGIGRVGDLPREQSLTECAQSVKRAFDLGSVRIFGDAKQMVKRAAVSPGSGKKMSGHAIAAKADVLITGDIDHHEGIDAVASGLCIIDAGHYGIEKLFVGYMRELLQKRLPEITVAVAAQKEPFMVL